MVGGGGGGGGDSGRQGRWGVGGPGGGRWGKEAKVVPPGTITGVKYRKEYMEHERCQPCPWTFLA